MAVANDEGHPATPEAFQARLVEIAGRSRSLNLRSFEESSRDAIVDQLVPRVRALLTVTSELLGRILEYYEARSGDSDHQRITDVAFMARVDLRFKQGSLQNLPATNGAPTQIIGLCASALSRSFKAVTAVENALCKHHGLVSRLSATAGVNAALEVRKAYARFRNTVLHSEPPTAEDLRHRLLNASIAIGRLVGCDVYREMRYHDRAELGKLQQRISAWMNEKTAGLESGMRLWQDLVVFTELLDAVNGRSELLDHDRWVADHVYSELFDSSSRPQRIPEELMSYLVKLYGRNEEIGKLIDLGGRARPDDWQAPLRRLRTELSSRTAAMEFLPGASSLG
ncbi:MAG: hypothetical protein GY856_07685 [bacterium]|nr:hypothetical protein [bacterium]